MAINRILVVEDEPSISDSVIYALSSDGYEAMVANTGERVRFRV
jgi:DNA-binding response OmpR family regulator